MGERDLDLSHKSYTNLHSLFRDNPTLWLDLCKNTFAVLLVGLVGLETVLGPHLDDFVLKDGITNGVPCHFSVSIDRCHLSILDFKLDFNVTAIKLLRLGSGLWPTHNLQSVSHVWGDQQIVGIDFKKWEHFDSEHVRYYCSVISAHTRLAFEGHGEGCNLVDTRLLTLGVEISITFLDLGALKASSAAQTHRFSLCVETH